MPVGKTSGYSTTNTILLRHGYLGSSPTAPQTCFSISLLHLFRQLVRACPRMSASAFCKALHFFHLVRFDIFVRITAINQQQFRFQFIPILRNSSDRPTMFIEYWSGLSTFACGRPADSIQKRSVWWLRVHHVSTGLTTRNPYIQQCYLRWMVGTH